MRMPQRSFFRVTLNVEFQQEYLCHHIGFNATVQLALLHSAIIKFGVDRGDPLDQNTQPEKIVFQRYEADEI